MSECDQAKKIGESAVSVILDQTRWVGICIKVEPQTYVAFLTPSEAAELMSRLAEWVRQL